MCRRCRCITDRPTTKPPTPPVTDDPWIGRHGRCFLFVCCSRVQLASTIRGVRYTFASVKEVLAKANPPKSGDDLAQISARDAVERVAARAVLADLTLRELREHPVVPYEQDELTRFVEDELDAQAYAAIAHLTVGQFREWLLAIETTGPTLRAVAPGLTPEMAAATCKLMSNFDLMTVGAKCQVVVRDRKSVV